jgi:hypothetical protein
MGLPAYVRNAQKKFQHTELQTRRHKTNKVA